MPIDDTIDPFGTPDLAINPNPSPSTFGTLKNQWDGFMAEPANRAALMSFGLQMMQPVGIGQSPAGHIAGAVGQAAEGARAAETLDIKQRVADTAEQRAADLAANREARLGIAQQGLGLREQALSLSNIRFGAQQDVAQKKLALANQLVEIKRQRADARSDYEAQTLDRQERNLQRQLDALDLQRENVGSMIQTREDRTAIQNELNDIRRQRAASTDANAKARLEQRERELQSQLEDRATGRAFSAAERGTARLEKLATDEAANIESQLQPDPLLPASRQKVPPQYKQYEGLSRSEIRARLLNDPTWRRAQTGRVQGTGGTGSGALQPTGGEGEVDPLEGKTATGPGGRRLIRRNGAWEDL